MDGEQTAMNPSVWRLFAFVGLIAVLVTMGLDLTLSNRFGDQGFTASFVDKRASLTRYRVISVKAGTPAAGILRPGDRFELADRSLDERVRYAKVDPGTVFRLNRERTGEPSRVVTLVIARGQGTAYVANYLYLVLRLAMAVVAGVIILRRPDLPEARSLATFFLLLALAISNGFDEYLGGLASIVNGIIRQSFAFLAFGQAVRFATIFPMREERGVRHIIRIVNPFVNWAIVGIGVFISWSVYVQLRYPPEWVLLIGRYPWAYYTLAIGTAFFAANARVKPEDRPRIRWISLSLLVGCSGLIAQIALILSGRTEEWISFLPITLFAIPLGMGYAIMRYRVLDIGFVINRAIVFGSVSIVVVLILGALEWFLGKVLVDASHTTSSLIELGLSLTLGLSLKSIHHRVDRFVDDFFFRDRHEAEASLLRFAREASFITDLDVLEDRAIATVVLHARAQYAAIYLAEPQRFLCVATSGDAPVVIDENDPAIVRLRAFREPLLLAATDTTLIGERAFPFVIRGHLTGALVIGPKMGAEAYAPDEVQALTTLASALGVAIDVLQTETLKREVERVLAGSLPLEGLRAAWERTAATSGANPASQGIMLATSPPQ